MSERVEMKVQILSLLHGLTLPHAVWQRYRKADEAGRGVVEHVPAADMTAVLYGTDVFWVVDPHSEKTRLFLRSPKRALEQLEALQGRGEGAVINV